VRIGQPNREVEVEEPLSVPAPPEKIPESAPSPDENPEPVTTPAEPEKVPA
jgi:hypothetical protein